MTRSRPSAKPKTIGTATTVVTSGMGIRSSGLKPRLIRDNGVSNRKSDRLNRSGATTSPANRSRNAGSAGALLGMLSLVCSVASPTPDLL
jgi:hypothetical protein